MSAAPSSTPKKEKKVVKDSKGRFAKGNKSAVGRRKKTADVDELRKGLRQAVDKQDVIDVVSALLKKAKRGNVRAADLLFDRLFGRVPPDFGGLPGMDDFDPDERFL